MLYDKLNADSHVLDVGSGSGYLTACFARAIQQKAATGTSANGIVVGIEHQPALVKLGKKNISADAPRLLESGSIILIGK